MKLTKKIARQILMPMAVALRLDRLLLARNKKRCCIVNFHGVRNSEKSHLNNRHLPATEFESLLKYFKTNFDVVSLATIFEMHRSKTKPRRKTVALTFDDGYWNNFTVALPLLEKYGLPATFFIIGKGIIDNSFMSWPDMLDVLTRHHKSDIVVNGQRFVYPGFVSSENGLGIQGYLKARGAAADSIVTQLSKNYPQYLETELSSASELLKLVTGDELKKYCNHPLIEFGSHSFNHPNLEYLDEKEQQFQLRESKRILEEACKKQVVSFAFPDGSYNRITLDQARDAGYSNLLAVDYRLNEKHATPNLLSRFTISNSTTWQSNALRLARSFDKFGF